jgi:hypothetical protein
MPPKCLVGVILRLGHVREQTLAGNMELIVNKVVHPYLLERNKTPSGCLI